MEKILKRCGKFLSVFIISTMVLGNIVFASDYSNHWAQKTIEKWSGKNVINGFPDGSFKPNQSITRAEFATLVNGLFNLTDSTNAKKYEDVLSSQWYKKDVDVISSHGVMNDYENNFKPDQYITREEATFAISNIYNIISNNTDAENSNSFKDSDKISEWATNSIYSLYNKGYISGRPDNSFDPKGNLTRAEMVTLIDKITSELLNVAGEYTYENKELQNLIINTKDVSLKNVTVKGNLYLTEGIGEGNVDLKDIKVNGTMYINGGGINSIHINGSSVVNSIVVKKQSEDVRVAVSGDSEIKSSTILSGAQLEGKFNNIEIETEKNINLKNVISENVKIKGNTINIDGGNLKKISLDNDKSKVNIKNARIGVIDVNKENNIVKIEKSNITTLNSLVNNTKVTTDKESYVTNVKVSKDDKISINGNIVNSSTSSDKIQNYINSSTTNTNSSSDSRYSSSSDSSSSGSSSGNTGGNNTVPTPPVIPPITPPVVDNIAIERVESIENGKLKVTLNKATTNTLQLKAFSVYCPVVNDMTIVKAETVEGIDKNKVYMLSTSFFKDNTYTLTVIFDDGSKSEYQFVSKYDCPNITSADAVRSNSTTAKFTFNSDELGNIYYMTVEESVYTYKAVVSEYASSTPTLEQIKTNGIKKQMVATSNRIEITDLKEDTPYSLFYFVEDIDGKRLSAVRGPISIGARAEELPPTGNITITNVKFISEGVDYKVRITLSEATSMPLELEKFYMKCPADDEIKFTRVENGTGSDINKVYTLIFENGGFNDNYYDIKVTLPDGTIAFGDFKCDLTPPSITGVNVTRTSNDSAEVVFYSTEAGEIYYGTTLNDNSKPKLENIKTEGKSTKLYAGNNTITLNNLTSNDKLFYYFPIDEIGNEHSFVDASFGQIPNTITPPPTVTSMAIDNIEISSNSMSTILKVTLNKDTTYLSSQNISVSGGNSSTPPRIFSLTPASTNIPNKVFTIKLNSVIPTGTYTLTITFDDGKATKTFDIK